MTKEEFVNSKLDRCGIISEEYEHNQMNKFVSLMLRIDKNYFDNHDEEEINEHYDYFLENN